MNLALSRLALFGAVIGFFAASRPTVAADWQQDFHLRDYMRIYDFPEEQLNYRVTFPPKTARRPGLRLWRVVGGKREETVFQLSKVKEENGFLQTATLSFRTNLPKNARRHFRLEHRVQNGPAKKRPLIALVEKTGDTAVLAANRLRIRVPAGNRFFPKPKKVSELPAPLLALARGDVPQDWCLAGSLRSGSGLRVVALNTKLLETGPLFARYRIEYVFEKGLQYIVVLTLRHNERHVTIDETFGGLEPRHEVFLRLDFTPGLNPDQRSVMSNGGYHAQGYSGAFGKKIDARGRLPIELR